MVPDVPPDTLASVPSADAQSRFGAAHARFARAALSIYLAGAAVSIVLLVIVGVTDREHESRQLVESLALQNQVHAQFISQNLALLASELSRLGRRAEVDVAHHDAVRARNLLEFSHRESAFFNEGVAIVGDDGHVVWAEPAGFLPAGSSVENEIWFDEARGVLGSTVVPILPERADDARIFVVSPVDRDARFAGAVVGGIDLGREGAMRIDNSRPGLKTLLTTENGVVVYPARPPAVTAGEDWKALFRAQPEAAFVREAEIGGTSQVLAGAPITGTHLVMVTVAERVALLAPARKRMITRLFAGLALALAPLIALILLLQRSLRVFRRSEAEAVREERLRMLGEASNLIAHEIKNSLNNLRVGVDVVVRRAGSGGGETRVFEELKREIQRLSEFTGELMTFSKGVTPRSVEFDLAHFVPEVVSLSREAAAEMGTTVDVITPEAPLRVRADPSLVHIVVSNLVANAVDAVAGRKDGGGRIEVRVESSPGGARVRVVDNGPGVPDAIRAHLFEPFVTGKPSGVGIGLALSRKIARAHGGDLVLDSLVPGASFSLVLPLQEVS